MKKFHYKGFHVRFGRYEKFVCVHGRRNGAFSVVVTRRGGYRKTHTSGHWSSGKRWVMAKIKKEIDEKFFHHPDMTEHNWF